jgi:hypothetical protein
MHWGDQSEYSVKGGQMQTAHQPVYRITPAIRKEIIQIIDDRVKDVHVTKEDFSELKSIVRDIADTQKRTETRMEELTEAQKRTETRMEELAEAQKRTETRMEELAEAQTRTELSVAKLSDQQQTTRTELAGLARSVSYALENEAYRQLPLYLKEHYGIEVTERIVRLEMDGEEINLFARARKDGRDVLIVGEAELKLTSVGKLKQLEKHVALAGKKYEMECIPLMITHFARPQVFEAAQKKGILIVQSFEW